MSYRVVLSDRTQITVTNEQGVNLMQIQASVKKPDYVNIADSQYRLSSITKVIKVADDPKPLPMLQMGNTSHEKSIHREIYYLFKKELQKEEPRKWEEFRQKAYDYLYTKSDKWCDDRKGTCVCEKAKPQMPVSTEQVKEVMKFMRS